LWLLDDFHFLMWIFSHIPLAGEVIQEQVLNSGWAFVIGHALNS
jgi:hypothetical protein